MAVLKYKDSNNQIKTVTGINVKPTVENNIIINSEGATFTFTNGNLNIRNEKRVLVPATTSSDNLSWNVEFNAEQKNGKVFSHFENDAGEILSYNNPTTMVLRNHYIDDNVFMKSIYSDEQNTPKDALGFIGNKGYSIDADNTKIYCHVYIERRKKAKELGVLVLMNKTQISDAEMLCGNSEVIRTVNIPEGDSLWNENECQNIDYIYFLNSPTGFSEHRLFRVRFYLITKDESTGEEITTYTRVIHIQL